ncbi:hypothetical protein H8K35_02425 [Undibacterium sp. LX40W]|uniref:SxtJ n=1 Tax=Undibacterium nitidum TaxID=2762298 RepID=A0A923HN66_9BURK|nr:MULTISPECIES: SxtJ family membrane protein [Undibacterium]MBC3880763.1 hypothetical protein [Undibacterium nitidum]MBC3890504.1 hypothetical protein [Undibacterium sp. LX40W]
MNEVKPTAKKTEPEMSTDRNFGLVMCGFFTILALLPLRNHEPMRLWALIPAALFLIFALVAPKALHQLNRAWMHFGELLSKLVSPVAMGLVFFIAITPFALVMRLFGKRPLDLSIDRSAKSYWKPRTPPGPAPESMKDQF